MDLVHPLRRPTATFSQDLSVPRVPGQLSVLCLLKKLTEAGKRDLTAGARELVHVRRE